MTEEEETQAPTFALPFRVVDSGGRELARVNRPLDAALLLRTWGTDAMSAGGAVIVRGMKLELSELDVRRDVEDLAAVIARVANKSAGRGAPVVAGEGPGLTVVGVQAQPAASLRLRVEDFEPCLQGTHDEPEATRASLSFAGLGRRETVELTDKERRELSGWLEEGLMALAASRGLVSQPNEPYQFELRSTLEIELGIYPEAFDPEFDDSPDDAFHALQRELMPREDVELEREIDALEVTEEELDRLGVAQRNARGMPPIDEVTPEELIEVPPGSLERLRAGRFVMLGYNPDTVPRPDNVQDGAELFAQASLSDDELQEEGDVDLVPVDVKLRFDGQGPGTPAPVPEGMSAAILTLREFGDRTPGDRFVTVTRTALTTPDVEATGGLEVKVDMGDVELNDLLLGERPMSEAVTARNLRVARIGVGQCDDTITVLKNGLPSDLAVSLPADQDSAENVVDGLAFVVGDLIGIQVDSKRREMERSCQALDDREPQHLAEVVCCRAELEWYSCREHAPKDVRAMPIGEWFDRIRREGEEKKKKSLGEALPAEMARVRDELIPNYVLIGSAGAPALAMMRAELDAASKALADGNLLAMIRSFQSLKGFTN